MLATEDVLGSVGLLLIASSLWWLLGLPGLLGYAGVILVVVAYWLAEHKRGRD